MKTFKDLKFEEHSIAKIGTPRYSNAKHATENFENGYGVSVLVGNCFYSNGVDTYELEVLHDGNITYSTDITDDVLGYITEEVVTKVMLRVQNL